MKDFIFVPGHAINPAAITHIKFNKDGSAHVMVGHDMLAFHGDDAKVFFDAAKSDAAKSDSAKAAKPAKTDPAVKVE